MLLTIAGREANGGTHCSLLLAKLLSTSAENPSELTHTEVWSKVIAVSGVKSAEGLLGTRFAWFSIGIAACVCEDLSISGFKFNS